MIGTFLIYIGIVILFFTLLATIADLLTWNIENRERRAERLRQRGLL